MRRSTAELLGKNITTFKVKLNTLYKYYNINFYKSQIVSSYFFIFPFLLFNKSWSMGIEPIYRPFATLPNSVFTKVLATSNAARHDN